MKKQITKLQYIVELIDDRWVASCPSLDISIEGETANDAVEKLADSVTDLILHAPDRFAFSMEILKNIFFEGDCCLVGESIHALKRDAFHAMAISYHPEWKDNHLLPIPSVDDWGDGCSKWDRANHIARSDFGRIGLKSELWSNWIKLALWWNQDPVDLVQFGSFEKMGVKTLSDRINKLGKLCPWTPAEILSVTKTEVEALCDHICEMGSENDNFLFDLIWGADSAVERFISERVIK